MDNRSIILVNEKQVLSAFLSTVTPLSFLVDFCSFKLSPLPVVGSVFRSRYNLLKTWDDSSILIALPISAAFRFGHGYSLASLSLPRGRVRATPSISLSFKLGVIAMVLILSTYISISLSPRVRFWGLFGPHLPFFFLVRITPLSLVLSLCELACYMLWYHKLPRY